MSSFLNHVSSMRKAIDCCLEARANLDWEKAIDKYLRPLFECPVNDKPPRKSALEQAFKEKMFLVSANESADKIKDISSLLELSVHCTDAILVEPHELEALKRYKQEQINTKLSPHKGQKLKPFQEPGNLKFSHTLFEELLETQSIDDCVKLFGFLEEHKTHLLKHLVYNQGRSLVIIRIVNELHKRTDQTSHLPFSGCVNIFSANAFAIDERSAVNLNADCHVSNMTSYELVDEEAQHAILYKSLWGLQDTFSNPYSITEYPKIQQLLKDMQFVLDQFQQISGQTSPSKKVLTSTTEKVSHSEEDRNGINKDDTMAGTKRKTPAVDPINEVVHTSRPSKKIKDSHQKTEPVQYSFDEDNKQFWPKFLTSQALFNYQVADPHFRSTILTQFLIALQYLEKFSGPKLDLMNATRTSLKITTPHLPKFKLTEEQLDQVSQMSAKVQKELGDTFPNGKQGLNTILRMLKNEERWNFWKFAERCREVAMPRIPQDKTEEMIRANRAKYLNPIKPLKPLGPTLNKFYNTQPEKKEEIAVEQKFKNIIINWGDSELEWDSHLCQLQRWQAWRSAYRTDIALFSKIKKFETFDEYQEFLDLKVAQINAENKKPQTSEIPDTKKSQPPTSETSETNKS